MDHTSSLANYVLKSDRSSASEVFGSPEIVMAGYNLIFDQLENSFIYSMSKPHVCFDQQS